MNTYFAKETHQRSVKSHFKTAHLSASLDAMQLSFFAENRNVSEFHLSCTIGNVLFTFIIRQDFGSDFCTNCWPMLICSLSLKVTL